MSIIKAMVEQRRLAAHARCRVKEWRITEMQAWQLADETRWISREFKERSRPLWEIVESMKRGEIRILGAMVHVRAAE